MDSHINLKCFFAFVFSLVVLSQSEATKFTLDSVTDYNLMENLTDVDSVLACARLCHGDVLCVGFHYCASQNCVLSTCLLFTQNLQIGQAAGNLSLSLQVRLISEFHDGKYSELSGLFFF